tara:strand:+ start:145 stop:387 length:243 start_codon:yes stop_codon:yes gene_type:complete
MVYHLLNLFIIKAFKREINSFNFTALANRLQGNVGLNSGIYAINLHLGNTGLKWINTSSFFNKPDFNQQLRFHITAIHEK